LSVVVKNVLIYSGLHVGIGQATQSPTLKSYKYRAICVILYATASRYKLPDKGTSVGLAAQKGWDIQIIQVRLGELNLWLVHCLPAHHGWPLQLSIVDLAIGFSVE
jgi:hypothetical protein